MIEVREKDGGVIFLVRVQPRASRNEFAGEWQGALRVRLAAPPVDERANEALRRLLAESLNVPQAAVRIAQGQHSRSKRVEVRGATAAQVRSLAAPQARQKPPTTETGTGN
jgi:uncharacterized protein (TIGR00251 family)